MVINPRLYLYFISYLSKIHKRLFYVPGRPVISNCGYYTENISAFVDHHLPPLPNGAILSTIDVVGLYPNIPHGEGLEAIKKAFGQTKTISTESKTISTESIVELAECVLKKISLNTMVVRKEV